MKHLPTIEEQEAAWFEYIALKRRAEEAFAHFKELFLAEDVAAGRIVERPRGSNVKVFPVHRTRASQKIRGGRI